MGKIRNNPNNYPDPQSPEGKSRAGRLYFSLLVVLFIFLGTVILIHQFGNNIIEKVQKVQIITFPTPKQPMSKQATEESGSDEQMEKASMPSDESEATETEPAEGQPADDASDDDEAPEQE